MASFDDDGFEEIPQRGFAASTPLETYEALYSLVLTTYGYRCALTGERFEASYGLLHARLEVVAIRPREHGGPLEISNYLPIVHDLVQAFERGSILVEDDYRIIVPNADLLPPETVARLRTALHVPADELFQPSPAQLAYHRRFVLGA